MRKEFVVDVRNLNLDNFKKNPILLWGHRYDNLPIGKVKRIKKIDNFRYSLELEFDKKALDDSKLPVEVIQRYLENNGFRIDPGYIINEKGEPELVELSVVENIKY